MARENKKVPRRHTPGLHRAQPTFTGFFVIEESERKRKLWKNCGWYDAEDKL